MVVQSAVTGRKEAAARCMDGVVIRKFSSSKCLKAWVSTPNLNSTVLLTAVMAVSQVPVLMVLRLSRQVLSKLRQVQSQAHST